VIDGHHRLTALKVLGFKYVPAVFVDYWRDVRRVGGWIYGSRILTDKIVEVIRAVLELLGSVKRGYSVVKVRAGELSAVYSVDAVDCYLTVKELRVIEYLSKYFVKAPHRNDACTQGAVCIEQPELSVYEVLNISRSEIISTTRNRDHFKGPLKEFAQHLSP